MSEFVLPSFSDAMARYERMQETQVDLAVIGRVHWSNAVIWVLAERDARHAAELAIVNGQAEGFAIAASSEVSRLKAEIAAKDVEISRLTLAPDPMRVDVRLKWLVNSEGDIRLYVGKVEAAVVFKSSGKWRFWFYIWVNRNLREEFDTEAEARAALLSAVKDALTGEQK